MLTGNVELPGPWYHAALEAVLFHWLSARGCQLSAMGHGLGFAEACLTCQGAAPKNSGPVPMAEAPSLRYPLQKVAELL